ncbi:MAG: hypothetical protein JXR05_08330 [Flavobacteriaceae bacterium]
MEALLNNLYIYEIVLLFLGVFLFMILCGVLVYYVVKKENIKKLLFFFMIPIIMIGYPSIQEIQIEKDKIAISKYKEQIRENPNDSTAIEKTEELIGSLEGRAKTTEDIVRISEAYLLIDKPRQAIDLVDRALVKEKNTSTKETKKNTENNFNTLVSFKKAAVLQQDIQANKISIQDTSQIKKRLKNIPTLNPKTQQYLNKRYLSKKRIKKNNVTQ